MLSSAAPAVNVHAFVVASCVEKAVGGRRREIFTIVVSAHRSPASCNQDGMDKCRCPHCRRSTCRNRRSARWVSGPETQPRDIIFTSESRGSDFHKKPLYIARRLIRAPFYVHKKLWRAALQGVHRYTPQFQRGWILDTARKRERRPDSLPGSQLSNFN